jgi:hypothetical protein
LERGGGIAETEGHPSICKGPIGTSKSGLFLIIWMDRDLEKSRVSIQIAKI